MAQVVSVDKQAGRGRSDSADPHPLQTTRRLSASSFSSEFIVATSASGSASAASSNSGNSSSPRPLTAKTTTRTTLPMDAHNDKTDVMTVSALFQNSTATIKSSNSGAHKRTDRSTSRESRGGYTNGSSPKQTTNKGLKKSSSSSNNSTSKTIRRREDPAMGSSVRHQPTTSRRKQMKRASSTSDMHKEQEDVKTSTTTTDSPAAKPNQSSRSRKVHHQTSSGSKTTSTIKQRRSSSANKHRSANSGSHSTTTTSASTASKKPSSAHDYSHLATPRRPGAKAKLRIGSSSALVGSAKSSTMSESAKGRSREERCLHQRERIKKTNQAQLPPLPIEPEQQEVVFKGWSQETPVAVIDTKDTAKDGAAKEFKKSGFASFGIVKMVGKQAHKLRPSANDDPEVEATPKSKKISVASAFQKLKGLASSTNTKKETEVDQPQPTQRLTTADEKPNNQRRRSSSTSRLGKDNLLPLPAQVQQRTPTSSRGRRARRITKGMDTSSSANHTEEAVRRRSRSGRRLIQQQPRTITREPSRDAPKTVGAGVPRPKLGKSMPSYHQPTAPLDLDDDDPQPTQQRKSHSMRDLMSSSSLSSLGNKKSGDKDRRKQRRHENDADSEQELTSQISSQHHYLTPGEEMEVDDSIPRYFGHHDVDDDDVLVKSQKETEQRSQTPSEASSIDDDIFPSPPQPPTPPRTHATTTAHLADPTGPKPNVKVTNSQQLRQSGSKPPRVPQPLVHPLTEAKRSKPKVQHSGGKIKNIKSFKPPPPAKLSSSKQNTSSKPTSKPRSTMAHPHTAPTGPKPKLSFTNLLAQHKKHPMRLIQSIGTTDTSEDKGAKLADSASEDDTALRSSLVNPFQQEHDFLELKYRNEQELFIQKLSLSDSFIGNDFDPSTLLHGSGLSGRDKPTGEKTRSARRSKCDGAQEPLSPAKPRVSANLKMLYGGSLDGVVSLEERDEAAISQAMGASIVNDDTASVVAVIKQAIEGNNKLCCVDIESLPAVEETQASVLPDSASLRDGLESAKQHAQPPKTLISTSSYNPMSAFNVNRNAIKNEDSAVSLLNSEERAYSAAIKKKEQQTNVDERSTSQSNGRRGLLQRASDSLRSLKEASSVPLRLLGEKSRSSRSMSGHQEKSKGLKATIDSGNALKGPKGIPPLLSAGRAGTPAEEGNILPGDQDTRRQESSKEVRRRLSESSAPISQNRPQTDLLTSQEQSVAHHRRPSLDLNVGCLIKSSRGSADFGDSVSDLAVAVNGKVNGFKTPTRAYKSKFAKDEKTPRIHNLTGQEEKTEVSVDGPFEAAPKMPDDVPLVKAEKESPSTDETAQSEDGDASSPEDSTIFDDSQQLSYMGSSQGDTPNSYGKGAPGQMPGHNVVSAERSPVELNRGLFTVVSEGTDGTEEDQNTLENSTIDNSTFARSMETSGSDFKISEGSVLDEADTILDETEHHQAPGEFHDSLSSLTSIRLSTKKGKARTFGIHTPTVHENEEDDGMDDTIFNSTAGMYTSFGSMSYGFNSSYGASFSQSQKVVITEELDPLPDEPEEDLDECSTINDTYHHAVSEAINETSRQTLVSCENFQETASGVTSSAEFDAERSGPQLADDNADVRIGDDAPAAVENKSELIEGIHRDSDSNDASFCKSQLLEVDFSEKRGKLPGDSNGEESNRPARENYFSQSIEMSFSTTNPGELSSRAFADSSKEYFEFDGSKRNSIHESNNSHMAETQPSSANITVKRGLPEIVLEQESDRPRRDVEAAPNDHLVRETTAAIEQEAKVPPKQKQRKGTKRHTRRKDQSRENRRTKGRHRREHERASRSESHDTQEPIVRHLQEALHNSKASLADSTLSVPGPVGQAGVATRATRGTAMRLASTSRSFNLPRGSQREQLLPKRTTSLKLPVPRASLDDGLHEGRPSTVDADSQLSTELRPLYYRPSLDTEARGRRQRDIRAMGGIPSFYDDDLYDYFDFIEKVKDSDAPQMNSDGEYDDYALTAPLSYRQWQGMPKIPAPIGQDESGSE